MARYSPSCMTKLETAESFAKGKHAGMIRGNGHPYFEHLEAVVNRIKGLGIVDEDILCAGWLHDTIEESETTFDELTNQFGKKVAVIVFSLSKNQFLSRGEREAEYLKLLKDASPEAKFVKLCDISANLSDLKDSGFSKSKIRRHAKQKRRYLEVIKPVLIENKEKFPQMQILIDGINEILKKHRQRPVSI